MTTKRTSVPTPARSSDNSNNSDPTKGYGWHLFVALMLLFFGLSLWRAFTTPPPVPPVDYSDFYAWAAAGEVQTVEISGQMLRGTLERPRKIGTQEAERFSTVMPSD